MKSLAAVFAVGLLAVAACTESQMPTESLSGLNPRFGPALAGCPGPFVLSGAAEEDAQAADRNGDGYACYLTDQQDGNTIRVWTDNNVPFSQLGGCPNSFTLVYYPPVPDGV
jgi:hypothetical protein